MSPPLHRTLLILAAAAMASAQVSLQGCYTSVQPLKAQGSDIYQSSAACGTTCSAFNSAVFATSQGNLCFCGNELPASSTETDSSACDIPCVAYPQEMCGGNSTYSVYLSGTEDNVPVFGGGSSGGSSSSGGFSSSSADSFTSTSTSSSRTQQRTRTRATVITSVNQGTTVYVTDLPASSATGGSGSGSNSGGGGGGVSVGAIAGSVVVGVVVLIAIVVGVWFFLRRRRQKSDEEEYKRTQVAEFMRGGERKPPNTGYSHSSDSRLDPTAGARRDSQGSIADAGDYSRRILRVANPT